MADFGVPAWLTQRQQWADNNEGLTPLIGGLVSGYQAGQAAAERRSFNKGVDAHNKAISILGQSGLLPQSAVEGGTMPKLKGNWFTDITGAFMGQGDMAENYLTPVQRASFNLKKQEVGSSLQMRMGSLLNQIARTDISRQNQYNKEQLELLTEGGVASFSEKWNELTAGGLMGTPQALAELQEIVGSNPVISRNPFVMQGLRMAEDAINLKSGASKNKPASISEFERDKQLQDQIAEELDPDKRRILEEDLQLFRRYAGGAAPQSGPPERDKDFGTIKTDDGTEMVWTRHPKTGALNYRRVPKSGLTDLQKMQYASSTRALLSMLTNGEIDATEYNKRVAELDDRFSKLVPTTPDPQGDQQPSEKDPLGLFK